MAQWDQISRDNLVAAGELMRGGHYRSSASRAYFAAFAGVSHALTTRGVTFSANRAAPSHQQLRDMVKQNLGGLPLVKRRRLSASLNSLYANRIRADYQPDAFVGIETARHALNHASAVIAVVGVNA